MRRIVSCMLLGLIAATPAYAQQFNVSNTSVNNRTLSSILGTPTGAMQLPSGTTAQEPDTGNPGELRYNTTTGRFEFGVGGAWDNFVRRNGDTLTGIFTGGTFSGQTLQNGTFQGNWNNSFFYPTLDTTGTVSDDAALQAEVNACSAVGGTIYLPAGKILLDGSAGTINLHSCRLEGSSFGGTEIDLTSTSVIPFTIGSQWEVEDVNFYWPNQTGTVVYPALFQNATNSGVQDFVLQNDNIINAYIALNQTATWSRFYIIGGTYFATDALWQTSSVIGDSSHVTSLQLSPGMWLIRCGYTTACKGYIDAGTANNAVMHGLNGALIQVYWANSGAFDWRYGILLDQGASASSSVFHIAWDGSGTILDTSADNSPNSWGNADIMSAEGHSICGVHYSFVSNANTASYPCFNIEGPSQLWLRGGSWTDVGSSDFVDMNSGDFHAIGTYILLDPPTTLASNIYVVNATGTSPSINLQDSTLYGYDSNSYLTGLYSSGTIGTDHYIINGNHFYNFDTDINLPSGNPAIISNNYSTGTVGTESVILQNGTFPISWKNNEFDKPLSATVTNCGTGATVSGAMSGTITVGSTVPTTVCKLTLPFNAPGMSAGSCVFSGLATTIQTTSAGNPVTWTLNFGADSHGDTINYNCPGNQ